MRGAMLVVLLALALPAGAAEPGPGPLADAACIECHGEATAEWKDGPHGTAPEVNCIACHGDRHGSVGSRPRHNETCIVCHEGIKGAPGRSYQTSKHGVIATIESARWDWSQPLSDANYRTPTCAYCHMHDATHGQLLSGEVLENSCLDCHSPRYVEALLDAGRRMLAVADLKLAEATSAAAATPEPEILRMVHIMRTQTMRNLRLGIGHQSPDYQWWYGHAALDGDLLRIKSSISHYLRRQAQTGR